MRVPHFAFESNEKKEATGFRNKAGRIVFTTLLLINAWPTAGRVGRGRFPGLWQSTPSRMIFRPGVGPVEVKLPSQQFRWAI